MRGATGRSGQHAREPQCPEIEFVDERIDDMNWVALLDAFFEAHRYECDLCAILALDETAHDQPPAMQRSGI